MRTGQGTVGRKAEARRGQVEWNAEDWKGSGREGRDFCGSSRRVRRV